MGNVSSVFTIFFFGINDDELVLNELLAVFNPVDAVLARLVVGAL